MAQARKGGVKAKPRKPVLTRREKNFVAELLTDPGMNATQAAIRAGFCADPVKAKVIACRIMQKQAVAAAVAEAMEKRSVRTEITQDMVLQELAKIGFADIRKIFTPGGNLIQPVDLEDGIAGAIQSIEVIQRRTPGDEKHVEEVHKIKLGDKRAALVDIGKHLGMFKEKPDDADDKPQPVTVIINGIDMSKPAGEPPAS